MRGKSSLTEVHALRPPPHFYSFSSSAAKHHISMVFSLPKQPNLYYFPFTTTTTTCIHLYFFPAPTPPPQHIYNVLPAQPAIKVY